MKHNKKNTRHRLRMNTKATPTCILQERRIRWMHDLSQSHAALIARLHYGEAQQ
ncbi:hypothetical protein [Loktanella sp. Alg231-35]|uniref:hypothetical protein n=1 Tax=Loktanella sp. Alg231-35 TaxID=1922220 RepID=UPI00131EEDAE|nr:hypothetical protein [Loktanella sp. Alg231-35]